MTDITGVRSKTQEAKNAFYRNKILNNPEFRASEKIRIREYNKAKYANDPEYAEKIRANRRAYYAKSKLLKQEPI